jgi:hypothetical protein
MNGTGSFSSLKVNDTLTVNHGTTIISGSQLVTDELTVLGAINARQFNISVVSSSVIYQSGSTKFGDTLDDIHDFTGSVNITGSFLVNGLEIGTTANTFDFNATPSAGKVGYIADETDNAKILPTSNSIDFLLGNNVVASIGVDGIVATVPAGTVSGSSQLTSSYDSRYVLSGSITQTTWDNIASKPSGIVSGSSQIDITSTTGYTTFSSSIKTVTDTFATSASIASATSASISDLSSSVKLVTDTFPTSASVASATSNSISTLSGSVFTNYAKLNSDNVFTGTQVITGSLFVSSNLVVQGSSSLQNITASAVSIGTNTVILNTANPSVRYGGISVTDSGSAAGKSGSLYFDSTDDEWIFVHQGNEAVTSSVMITGPETYNNVGNEINLTDNRVPKIQSGFHIVDSNISDNGTLVTINSATQISGSLGVTGSLTINGTDVITNQQTISASAWGAFQSASSYSSSLATSISASNYIITINSASVSSVSSSFGSRILTIEGKTLVSGSSQIDVMSTTNIARLATTGSNTFTGTQTISGSLNVSGSTIFGSNVGFGVSTPQSQVHLNGEITFTEFGFDTVRKHAITHGHSDGSSPNNYVAINVSNGAGTTAERIRINGSGQLLPAANGTQDLGSTSLRWGTIYTSDLSLNNGIGDWTIVEGEDDLFLYNNKKGKVYKFALTEVDPNVATPKKS